MQSICRLCLADNASFSIFSSNASVVPIRMMLLAVEVQPNDGLPQAVCANCRLRLEEFYYFRKRCHAVDLRLRRHKRLQSQGKEPDLYDPMPTYEENTALVLEAVGCTQAACVESALSWRAEAAELMRTEMDAYKLNLMNICKQQVREEVEEQVRNELEAVVIAEAKKQCRLNVLDDLFNEIERFFVRKRNETVDGQLLGSEGFISDSETFDENNSTHLVDCSTSVNNTEDVVELTDDETWLESTGTATVLPISSTHNISETVVPMVEINMPDNHLYNSDEKSFVKHTKAAKVADAINKKPVALKRKKKEVSVCARQNKCRKHSANYDESNSQCVRCRLRPFVVLESTGP